MSSLGRFLIVATPVTFSNTNAIGLVGIALIGNPQKMECGKFQHPYLL